MRTIEATRDTGEQIRIVLSKITVFMNWPIAQQRIGHECTFIRLGNDDSVVIRESLDSFSARYEAAMDEMINDEHRKAYARQWNEVVGASGGTIQQP